MMIGLLPVAAASLQGASGPAGTPIGVAAEISTVVIAVISVILLLVAIGSLVQFRKLLRSLQQHVEPVTDRARVAAENVEYISAVVREDVQKIRGSVSGLSGRLKDASERMEERVEEFNALMDVVQDEAEAVLLDTASVVRGVRAGAQTMGERVTGDIMGDDADGPETQDDANESESQDDASESGTENDVGEAMAKEAPESG